MFKLKFVLFCLTILKYFFNLKSNSGKNRIFARTINLID